MKSSEANFNTTRPEQNSCNDVDIIMQISLKFGSKGSNDNNSALIEIMAWHRIGDKPLPEPMMSEFMDAVWCH